jgi:hypothetical protein
MGSDQPTDAALLGAARHEPEALGVTAQVEVTFAIG